MAEAAEGGKPVRRLSHLPRAQRTDRALSAPVGISAATVSVPFARYDALGRQGVAVAVSGGGDSMALLLLLADHARTNDWPLPVVVTVDHALRPGSDAEARQVAAWAKTAGLEAAILVRQGAMPSSNLEAYARECRYGLIGAWAKARKLTTLCVAHTRDDQAETFLIRLMRGSGVDGLSAMRSLSPYPVPGFSGLQLWRPLLTCDRAELRAYLQDRGQSWIEDPMNEDPQFARVRLRHAWPALEALGFDRARLAATAAHLARARVVLETQAEALFARVVLPVAEGVLIDAVALADAPQEIGLRVLAHCLGIVSQRRYRPRFERLERLYGVLCRGGLTAARTLHGCRIGPAPRRYSQFGAQGLLVSLEPARKASAQS